MEAATPLCIYHGHCDDGFAAAWALRDAFPGQAFDFYPGVYQQPPPDVTGRDVVLVDFSYKRPVIDEIASKARTLLILDHHKTAHDDLTGLPAAGAFHSEWLPKMCPGAVGVLFDMNRSGAGISWDFFHNGKMPRPEFIDYIEDRDLWRKALPNGDEFTIALRSYPQDFAVWDTLVARGVSSLIATGHDIQRYYRLRVDEIKRSAYRAQIDWIGFHDQPKGDNHAIIAIANAPYFAASEVAGELAEEPDVLFGACYFEVSAGRWQYSLRSRDGYDVSQIARAFGGGGHPAAAGFTVDKPVHRAYPLNVKA